MGDLTNKQISQTFPGLIKTNDELALDGTAKALQDGVGNNTGLQLATGNSDYITYITSDDVFTNGLAVSSTGVAFAGSVDFTTATVTGIDTGVTSIIAGTNITIDQPTGAVTISASGGGGGGNVAFSMPYIQLSGPSAGDAIGNSVLIPANSFANGDLLQVRGTVIKSNPAGWQYLAMWINTDNTTLFAGTQLGTDQSPLTGTELPVLIFKTLAISTNDSRTYGGDWNQFYDTVNTTVALNADINWGLDQYLNFYYFIDDAASTCTIQNITIKD